VATDRDEDVDAWVNGLAGSPGAEPAGPQVQALRRAVLAQYESQELSAATDDPAWQQLRFRLRRERLITAGRPSWRVWVPAAAAAMLAVALAVPMLMPSGDADFPVGQDAPPVLRGGHSAQELYVRDPLGSARKAARIVAQRQGRPVLHFHEGRSTLDFEIEAAAAAETEKELKREFPQAVVQSGLNRLVFRQQP